MIFKISLIKKEVVIDLKQLNKIKTYIKFIYIRISNT